MWVNLRQNAACDMRPLPQHTSVQHVGSSSECLHNKTRNLHLLRLLERIAAEFNEAGIPIMALKGAALNFTIFDQPDQRPMSDLDLLIRPEHAERAFVALMALGCHRGQPLVREDFFPRFHYEAEFIVGQTFPLRIDLHVRPFRPLRWSQLVPPGSLWEHAESVPVGQASVLIPSPEDMLVHLAAHSAIHGNVRLMWFEDIKRWVDARRSEIDWDRFLTTVRAWQLALPVREAISQAESRLGQICPTQVRSRLAESPTSWRDRLALWHAPRDAAHPATHIVVNAACTPGWRFVLGYLWAVLFPDRVHMEQWYGRTHWGWLPCAHLMRLFGPVWRRLPKMRIWFKRTALPERHGRRGHAFTAWDTLPTEAIARLHVRRPSSPQR